MHEKVETLETLDTVVVPTFLDNYARSVSSFSSVSYKNPHVSLTFPKISRQFLINFS